MGGLRTDWSIASSPITNRDNIAETLVLRAFGHTLGQLGDRFIHAQGEFGRHLKKQLTRIRIRT